LSVTIKKKFYEIVTRPTGVTREDFPKVGGSYGLWTTVETESAVTDDEIRLIVDDPVVDSDGVKLSVDASGANVGDGRRCFCAAAAAAADSSFDFTWTKTL
jgi:hypothetical protein